MKLTTVLIAIAVACTGCVVGETDHRIYLEPDGSVTWVVLETELRSDAEEPGERRVEEAELMTAVTAWSHGAAMALSWLGADALDVRVLRDRRPYSLWTEARFRSPEVLVRSLLEGLDVPASVHLEPTADGWRLSAHLVVSDEAGDDTDEVLLALLDEPETYRIAVSGGRFVAAQGFTIVDDGAAVVPCADLGEEAVVDGTLSLSLEWVDGG